MPLRKPTLTLTSRLLIRLTGAISGWSRRRSLLSVLALFAAIVAIDFCSGVGVSINFLYLSACALAVWCLGEKLGMMISTPGAIAGALVMHIRLQQMHLEHPFSAGAELWNLLARLISFALVAVVVNGLCGVLALERWRADHDGLTGALNRRAFEREMAAAAARARGEGRGLVFAYMDLDGFKGVNDQHGHSAGDRVLSEFAAAAGAAIRETDLFARLGGDEFATLVVLPEATNGTQVAEALHRRLTTILAATGFDVTCSMGAVVMTGRDAVLGDGVMEQADALMYEAKRAGKNAVRVARGNAVAAVLRGSYRPTDEDDLQALIARIDRADRRLPLARQRAA